MHLLCVLQYIIIFLAETFTPKPTTPTVPTSQPTTGSVGVSSTKSTTRSTVKLPSTTVLPSRKATAMATEFTKGNQITLVHLYSR